MESSQSLLNNPEYCSLFEQRATAFNDLVERIEGLNIPQQTYKELLSGLHELEDATETSTKFELIQQVKAIMRQELAKMGIDIDTICPKSPVNAQMKGVLE